MSPLNNSASKVGVFVLALAALAGGGYALGDTIDPAAATEAEEPDHDSAGHDEDDAAAAESSQALDIPGGLQVSENGYTLVPAEVPAKPGVEGELSFQITGPDGSPVTEFETAHDKKLHLIVVRRDLSGFRHVHPTMAADGTWSIPFTFAHAGTYRLFADFQPAGSEEGLTLGTDVQVAGNYAPAEATDPTHVAKIGDYEVELEGDLVPGTASKLTLSVAKNGKPVTDLDPYLGAFGHLVALREGDLAYLHVHPDGEPGDGQTKPGPSIVFYAEVPSEGSYGLFLDFAHEGVVRTAEFTAVATGESVEGTGGSDGHGGHGSES